MKFTDLQRIYGNAERELRSLLLSVDLIDFDGAKAEKIKHKARQIVTYLNAISGRWTQRISREAYAKAEKQSRAALARLGKTRARGPEPSRSGPKVVQDIAETALLRATGSIMRTVENYVSAAMLAAQAMRNAPRAIQAFDYADFADDIADLASEAVKNELARGTLQKQIMDLLRQAVVDGDFIIINDRYYNLRKYAKMLARTTLHNAQAAATLDSCKRFENDLVEITDHNTICNYCKQFEGGVFSISGNDPDYPSLDSSGFLEAHPNCEHRALPTSREAQGAREIFG